VSPLGRFGLFHERVPQERPAVAEVDCLKVTTVLAGLHYVPGRDGGRGTPTTDHNAAWSEAPAAHERGERNAGVTRYTPASPRRQRRSPPAVRQPVSIRAR
jgi:hypothetical protein